MNYQCSATGCTNAATCRPVLKFWAKGYPQVESGAVRAVIDLPICAEHAILDPSQFCSDAGWDQIMATFIANKKAPPSRESLKVEFVPIADALAASQTQPQAKGE